MPKYVIERDIPGAGKFSGEVLQSLAQTSRRVLRDLGSDIHWIKSYVTEDKFYCVYIAPNPELIRKHAEMGGFPCNKISEVNTIIDQSTAE